MIARDISPKRRGGRKGSWGEGDKG
jgi:hypothetical protein